VPVLTPKSIGVHVNWASITGLAPVPYELKVILFIGDKGSVTIKREPALKLMVSPELNLKELILEILFHAADEVFPELASLPPSLST